MAKVVTFGEIMLRLAPNGYYRFFQNDQMQATFGGGEANVAVSLANFGLQSVYVTKLPAHAIGQAAVDSLRHFGVDTSQIVRGGHRIGIYYLPIERQPKRGETSMTAHIPRFLRQFRPISIGTAFWMMPTGFTSPASHRHWDLTYYRFAGRPASQPKQRELRSPAT